jgi:hypothetical protein
MSADNLIRALRAVYERDVQRAPTQHPLRTPDCPPLTRFGAAAPADWTPEERQHAAHCPYCQKVLAMKEAEERRASEEARRPVRVIPLPNLRAAAAATGATTAPSLRVRVPVPDPRLEAEFLQEGTQLVLELLTRDAALNGQLFRFAFRDVEGREAVTGFILLRPNKNGFAGHASFDAEALFVGLGGQTQEPEITPVDAS